MYGAETVCPFPNFIYGAVWELINDVISYMYFTWHAATYLLVSSVYCNLVIKEVSYHIFQCL